MIDSTSWELRWADTCCAWCCALDWPFLLCSRILLCTWCPDQYDHENWHRVQSGLSLKSKKSFSERSCKKAAPSLDIWWGRGGVWFDQPKRAVHVLATFRKCVELFCSQPESAERPGVNGWVTLRSAGVLGTNETVCGTARWSTRCSAPVTYRLHSQLSLDPRDIPARVLLGMGLKFISGVTSYWKALRYDWEQDQFLACFLSGWLERNLFMKCAEDVSEEGINWSENYWQMCLFLVRITKRVVKPKWRFAAACVYQKDLVQSDILQLFWIVLCLFVLITQNVHSSCFGEKKYVHFYTEKHSHSCWNKTCLEWYSIPRTVREGEAARTSKVNHTQMNELHQRVLDTSLSTKLLCHWSEKSWNSQTAMWKNEKQLLWAAIFLSGSYTKLFLGRLALVSTRAQKGWCRRVSSWSRNCRRSLCRRTRKYRTPVTDVNRSRKYSIYGDTSTSRRTQFPDIANCCFNRIALFWVRAWVLTRNRTVGCPGVVAVRRWWEARPPVSARGHAACAGWCGRLPCSVHTPHQQHRAPARGHGDAPGREHTPARSAWQWANPQTHRRTPHVRLQTVRRQYSSATPRVFW